MVSVVNIKALSRENARQQFVANYPSANILEINILQQPFGFTGSPFAKGIGMERNQGLYQFIYE